jgi:uncharacterized protein
MPTSLTPGVIFERPAHGRSDARPLTDVAGFVGVARRGPLHRPVRVTSWRQFQEVFGTFAPYANLAYAVRGFFENRGRTCWVVRVANSETARSASVTIPDAAGDPAYRVTASSPGVWANELGILVQPDRLASARQDQSVRVDADDWLAVDSVAGLEVGSRVRLTQLPAGGPATRCVEEIDAARGLVRFDRGLLAGGLVPTGERIALESIEFSLLVLEAGQVVERHAGLAPDRAHPRDAVTMVAASSTLITLDRLAGAHLPTLPWGGPIQGALGGGVDGLRDLGVSDLAATLDGEPRGIHALAEIDEVAILALPDLVAPAVVSAAPPVRPLPLDPCDERLLEAGDDVDGTVVDDGTGAGLAGVHVQVGGHDVVTDGDGSFTIPGGFLDAGTDVYFDLDGYDSERRVIAAGAPDFTVRLRVAVAPDIPPGLRDDDVYFAQSEMVAQCESLRDRFCIIEAPYRNEPDIDLGPVRGWRARFDSPFVALYHPWIVVRDPLQPQAVRGRAIPPAGHIAGVYAATDLAANGAHRPPANVELRFLEDLIDDVDDARQGVLNPIGINAIRAFPGRGIRAFGARTLSSDSAWRYVNVRRLMSAIEEQITDGIQWAVFEPHDEGLRLAVRMWLTRLADEHWRRGALAGATPEQAYLVRCDDTTMTPDDVDNGRLIALLSVAPTVPYEFIVVRLGLSADEISVSEVVA